MQPIDVLTATASVGGGFATGYVYASLLESFFHEHVNDAPKRRVEAWKERYPRLFKQLIETNFSHHLIHHGQTYRKDHVTQFVSAEQKEALDARLRETAHGREVIKAEYGNAFSPMGWVAFTAPLWPGALLTWLIFNGWFAAGFSVATMLPPVLSNYVHRYLHMPYRRAIAEAPWPLSLILRTRYMRAVTRHHFVHHRHCRYNFNLLLGGDWLRRRVRAPDDRDIAEMIRVGIRLD